MMRSLLSLFFFRLNKPRDFSHSSRLALQIFHHFCCPNNTFSHPLPYICRKKWGLWSVFKVSCLLFLHGHLCPCSRWVPAILPDLIPHGLPTGCSTPSTTSTLLRTVPFGHCITRVPTGAGPPTLPPHCGPLPTGCSSGPGRSCGGTHGLCLLQASSTAAPPAPPWLHGQMCSARCPRAAGGRPAPPWTSSGLQKAAAVCLELFLSSICADLGACRAVLSHLSPLSPSLLMHSSFSLSEICY